MESIVLGGGCFWCIEGVFLQMKGITSVTSGYAGGVSQNPTYKEICSGQSGHAEVVRVEFSSDEIDLKTILEIFFTTHDPTTLNRQGNDVGTQYRSVIYYENDLQQKTAVEVIENYASQLWDDPIVTELSPLPAFYQAEIYHQNYYQNNPAQAYCAYVVAPKISKARAKFSKYLK